MKKLLFVCLGNICRSPAAEAVMKDFIEKSPLKGKVEVDSCGTSGHHSGEMADNRMRSHARKRGYNLESIARGFQTKDFNDFDYILTMDNSNYNNILALDPKGEFKGKVFPMVQFCKEVKVSEVPDPYYGGAEGFEHVLDILEDACENFLNTMQDKLK